MRFRLLASADHHFHESLRFDECQRVHAFMVDVARERQIDAFLSAGDVYEAGSTPREREAVADWLTAMAEVCPALIAKGNHDKQRDVLLMRRLATRHPVTVEERAGVHYIGGAAVATMAWPERAGLLSALGEERAANLATREMLQAVLRGLGDQLEAHDGPRILLGHFMVDGSQTSTGQPLLGMPINVSLSDLALARAHLGLMGHIHLPQWWDVLGAPHGYVGSPFRTDFGQLEQKTITYAEFDGPNLVTLEHIPTPCTPMIHVSGAFDGLEIAVSDADRELVAQHRGAEIRLQYTVRPDQQQAARAAAERLEAFLRERAGAVAVKVEPQVIAERRARAPEVARAQGIRDKLPAHWASIGFDPGERRESLLEKASTLEAECGARVSRVGAGFRLDSVRFKNVGPYADFELDFRSLGSAKVVGLVGKNGVGKTFALETGVFGVCHRTMPTQGKLPARMTSKDACVDARVFCGQSWRIQHFAGATVVQDEHGLPAYEGTGTNAFKAWAAKNLPSEDVLRSTIFAVQKKEGFIELGSAARTSVILQVIGVERIERMAEAARKRVQACDATHETLLARLADAEAAAPSVDEARAELEARTQATTALEAELEKARAEVARGRAELAELERLRDQAEAAARRRQELQAALDEARVALASLESRAAEARTLVQRGDEIKRAAAQAEKLRRQAEAAERECFEVEQRTASARSIREGLSRRLVELGEKVGYLEERIANNRALLRDEKEIRDAAVRTDACNRRAEQISAEIATATLELKQHDEAARLHDAAAKRAGERERAAAARREGVEKRLADREAVLRAKEDLESVRAACAAAEKAELDLDRMAKELRAAQLSSAADARAALRKGHEDNAQNTTASADELRAASLACLQADDAALAADRDRPAAIAEAEAAFDRARLERSSARRRLYETETLAKRAGEIDQALEELREVDAEIEAAKSAQEEAQTAARAARAEASSRQKRLNELADELGALREELTVIEPKAELLEGLKNAETRLAVLEPEAVSAREDLARAEQELADAPALPEPFDSTELEGLRRKLAELEPLVSELSALQQAEGRLEALAPELDRARAAVARAEGDLAAAPLPPALPVDPEVALLEQVAAEVEKSLQAARAAQAKAEAGIEQAQAAAGRVDAIRADLRAAEAELADWARLALDLGRDGIQSAEVDSAGPELTALANDLLLNCYGSRYTISIDTSRLSADGKKQVDECRVNVFDSLTGHSGEAREFSGGERDILGEAVSLALTMLGCARAGVTHPTLIRDESGGGLDSEKAPAYARMLRRAVDAVGADKLILISHNPRVSELCDVLIEVGDGEARVAA